MKKINVGILQILILILALFTVCFFAYSKQGFFMDELYSYGLSNSHGHTDISDYNIYDREITDNPFDDYLVVQDSERFEYPEVIQSQEKDVHPPLYYIMLHTICSLTPNVFSKWSGLALNIVLYMLTTCVIMKLGLELTTPHSKTETDSLTASDSHTVTLSIAPAVMWAFSCMGLGDAIYIRMYMLLTLLTICDIYIHISIIKRGLNARRLVLIAICTISGFLTQYYFLVCAFWISICTIVLLIKKKNYWDGAIYSGIRLVSLIGGVVLFPQVFEQLSGNNNNYIASLSETPKLADKLINNFIAFISDINYGLCSGHIIVIAVVVLIVLILLAVLCSKTESEDYKKKTINDSIVLVLGMVAILDVITIIMASWIPARRYYYNIIPILCIVFVYVLKRYTDRFKISRYKICGIGLIVLIFALSDVTSYVKAAIGRDNYIQYLYQNEQSIMDTLEGYGVKNCIYITDKHNAAITQDLYELRCMDRVYITSRENIGEAIENFNTGDKILIIIDKNYDVYDVMVQISNMVSINPIATGQAPVNQRTTQPQIVAEDMKRMPCDLLWDRELSEACVVETEP